MGGKLPSAKIAKISFYSFESLLGFASVMVPVPRPKRFLISRNPAISNTAYLCGR